MAITLHTAGSWVAANATTQVVTLPTHSTGDMLIVWAGMKHATLPGDITINQGFTQIDEFNSGTAASSNGGGDVEIAAFWKVATSASETNPTLTFHASVAATPSCAVAHSYSISGAVEWGTPTGASGSISVATGYSATMGSHIPASAGDWLLGFVVTNDNTTLTVPTLSQAGLTLAAVVEHPATALSSATSNDIAADGCYRSVTSGTSSAAAVFSGTNSVADIGAAMVIRLHQNLLLTLDLIDAGNALYAPTLDQPAGGDQSITLGLLDASNAVYAPTLQATNTLTLALLDASPALYAPTISTVNTISLGLLDAAPALFAPTLTPTNTLTLGLIDASPALFAPTLLATNTLTLGLLDAAPALYAPTLALIGAQDITLGLIDAGSALYAPTLTTTNAISLALIDAAPALYAPTVLATNTLTLGLLDAGPALYAPTIYQDQFIVLDLLDAGPTLYAPTVSQLGGLQTIELGLLDSGPDVYAPVINPAAITLGLALLDSSPALYAPSFATSYAISLGLLDASNALYAPTLTSLQIISLGLLDSGSALYAPQIVRAGDASPKKPPRALPIPPPPRVAVAGQVYAVVPAPTVIARGDVNDDELVLEMLAEML